MMSALSASTLRSAAPEAPLSLAELGGAVLAGLVPLPAESAGYLLLGLADQMARAPLPLDLRAILLSPEGNLSMLALTTTSRGANADESSLERQLRTLLGRLLATAPVQAPALSAVARRPPQGSLAPLIHELEAALIPVNRAAGRRSLARIHRETERVRPRIPALLSLSPEPAPRPTPRPVAAPLAPAPAPVPSPAPPPRRPDPIPLTLIETPVPARAAQIPSLLPPATVQRPTEPEPETPLDPTEAQHLPAVVAAGAAEAPEVAEVAEVAEDRTELRAPLVEASPEVPCAPEPSAAPLEVAWTDTPGAVGPLRPVESVESVAAAAFVDEDSAGARAPTIPLVAGLRPATVEQLLNEFALSDGLSEREINRMLKQAVGVELSALPPGVETLAPPVAQDASLWQPAPEVILVNAPIPPSSFEPRPPRNPRASLAVTFVLLLLGLAATVAVWVQAPGFFSGRGP
jgi:hypothetical protein